MADAAGEATYPVLNPATGAVLERVPRSGVQDARAAIDTAREAFDRRDPRGLRRGERPPSVRQRDTPRRVQESGFGKDLSMYAVEEYTNIKHVWVELMGAPRKPWHYTVYRPQG